jgi:hypothetical protein
MRKSKLLAEVQKVMPTNFEVLNFDVFLGKSRKAQTGTVHFSKPVQFYKMKEKAYSTEEIV